MKKLILSLAVLTMAGPALAADIITKNSPHSVSVTMDRLIAAVDKAGAKVAARIDHAKAAKGVGIDMPDNQAVIFGNPKIGSPIMVENPAAGLDLPIRVVVYTDKQGKTVIAYHDAKHYSEKYGVPADLKSLGVMAGALDKLTNAAIAK